MVRQEEGGRGGRGGRRERRKEGEEGEREGTGGKKTSEEGADCNCHLRPSATAAAELLTPTATFK